MTQPEYAVDIDRAALVNLIVYFIEKASWSAEDFANRILVLMRPVEIVDVRGLQDEIERLDEAVIAARGSIRGVEILCEDAESHGDQMVSVAAVRLAMR